jgi:hypothetical protein
VTRSVLKVLKVFIYIYIYMCIGDKVGYHWQRILDINAVKLVMMNDNYIYSSYNLQCCGTYYIQTNYQRRKAN